MAIGSTGSSIDVNAIVAQLMSVEARPITALQSKEAVILGKISAYGSVKSSLSSFQSALASLKSASAFSSMTASASDATILSASTNTVAKAGTYSIAVSKLAQAQSLASAGQASTISSIGGGTATTLSFSFGTVSGGTLTNGTYAGATFTAGADAAKTVVIDSSNNSLQGIRDAINKAGVGVTASIVNDGAAGTPYRLMLTSTSTGEAKAMKITSDGGDASVAALLEHDSAGTQNFTQTVVAQDAALSVNGLAIGSATNTVSDAIAGVSLSLAKVGSSNLTVSNNTASITSAVQGLVKAFNDTNGTLKTMNGYNATTKKGGPLLGDSTIQAIQYKLRATFATALPGLGSNTLKTMTDIGVEFQKDGTLKVDNTKLQKALTDNFGDFAALFAATGAATDSLVTYTGSTSKSVAGSYAVDVTSLARQGKAEGITKPSSLAGSVLANLTIDATNDKLMVDVDGEGAVAVTLTPGAPYASAAALALQVQSDINTALAAAGKLGTVSVSDNAGKLSISSASAAGNIAVTEDSGSPGNIGAASLLGTPVKMSNIVTGVNDQLTVSISGTSATVTLAAGSYTGATLATQLQSAINGTKAFTDAGMAVAVASSGDQLSVTSTRYGVTSAVNITAGSAYANLFSGAASSTIGADVVGTINGAAATGLGQFLTADAGTDAEGLKLQISGGSAPGSRGSVNYSQGYAYLLNEAIDDFLSSDGAIASNTNSANKNIEALQKRAKEINTQLEITEKRYRAQFTALDQMMTKLQQTSSFLEQQLAGLASLN